VQLIKLNFYYGINVRKSLVAKDSATNGYEHTKCSEGIKGCNHLFKHL